MKLFRMSVVTRKPSFLAMMSRLAVSPLIRLLFGNAMICEHGDVCRSTDGAAAGADADDGLVVEVSPARVAMTPHTIIDPVKAVAAQTAAINRLSCLTG